MDFVSKMMDLAFKMMRFVSEFLRFHDAPDLPHPRLKQSAQNLRQMAELQRDQ